MADDVRANIDLNIDTSKALSGLKALQSQLSVLHTQLSSLGPAQRSSAGAIQRQLVDNINATGKFAASMTTVKTTAESFTTALEKNKLTMGEYFRYAGGASKSFGRGFAREFATIEKVAVERVKTLQTQYVKLGRDANGAMKAIAVRPLTLDMDNLQTKTAIAAQKQLLLNQLLKQGSTQMLNWGKNTQWAGRQLMVGFTIPLGIFAGQAMKAFSDMEKQIIAFKRVYGDLSTSAKDTDAMAESIAKLAGEFTKYGLAVSDTMEMASKAAAMGKTGADLLGQVQQASKLAVLGQVEQQQALQTTISLTDTFGTAAEDLGKKINFLNAVENQTAVSIEDLTIAIPKAGPVIKQLGGDVEDLAFFLTAMREGGINASEGANALKSGLAAMINPTGKAAEMLEGFGINLQKIVKTNKGDVRGTVVEFAKALDTLDPLNRAKAIEQLFGKFQFSRISTLMKNVISDTSQASTTAQLAQRSSIELAAMAAREMRKISSSPLFKFQKALQDFQVQLAPIGEAFMKFVTPIIDWVNGMLKAFNSLSDGTKTFIVGFTSVVAGLGPILLMTFGLIANGFANLIKGFTALKSMFNKVQTSSQILGQETSYMTQEQMKAKAVAASLDQVHGKLIQTFNVEAGSVNKLASAYERAVVASQRLMPVATGGKGKAAPVKKFAKGGMIYGPGTGTSDSIPAMVSNGEFIMPAKQTAKYRPFLDAMSQNRLPRFAGKNGNVAGESLTDRLKKRAGEAPGWISKLVRGQDWESRNTELNITVEEAKKDGVDLRGEKRLRDTWLSNHASHKQKDFTQVDLGQGITSNIKNWNAPNISTDIGPINKALQNISADSVEQMLGFGPKSFKKQVYTTFMDNLEKHARETKIKPADLKATAERLFTGQHPATREEFRVMERIMQTAEPVAKKGTGWQYRAAGRISGARARDRKKTSFIDTANSRTLRVENNEQKNAANVKRIQDNQIKILEQATKEEVKALATIRGKSQAQKTQDEQQSAATKTSTKAKKETAKADETVSRSSKETAKEYLARAREERKIGKKTLTLKQKRVLAEYDAVQAQAAERRRVTIANKKSRSQAQQQNMMNLYGTTNPTQEQIQAVRDQKKIDEKDRKARGAARQAAMNKKPSLFGFGKASQDRRVNAASRISGGAAMGVGMGISIAGSAAGMAIGGDVGNTIANVSGVAGTVAMVGAQFPKLLLGIARFIPYIGLATVAIGGLAIIADEMTKVERKRVKQSKDTAAALDMTEDKAGVLANFFGKSASSGGIQNSSGSVTNLTDPQSEAVKELRLSDEFKGVYAAAIESLRNATNEQGQILLENIALQLSPNFADEEIEVIVDALRQEAGRTDLKLDFASIDVSTDEGFERSLERLDRAKQDAALAGDTETNAGRVTATDMERYASAVDQISNAEKKLADAYLSNDKDAIEKAKETIRKMREFIADYLPEDLVANMQIVTDVYSSTFDALRSDLESGKITVEEYNEKLKQLNDSILSMDYPSQQVFAYNLVESLPESDLKDMISGLAGVEAKMYAVQAAAVDLGKSLAIISELKDLDAGIGGPKSADAREKWRNSLVNQIKGIAASAGSKDKDTDTTSPGPAAEDPRITAANKKIDKYKTGIDYISNIEDKINDKYDKRIEALDEVQKINDEISQQQRDQLDLADALARGDIGAAARAAQTMRANEQNLQIQRQKDGLDAARQLELDSVTDPLGRTRAYLEGKIAVLEQQIARIEFWKVNKKAKGGVIKAYRPGGKVTGPGTGTSDDIPAMLSNGEYVIRAKAVKALGVDTLDKMNHAEKFGIGGFARRYADGGIVERLRKFRNSERQSSKISSLVLPQMLKTTRLVTRTKKDTILAMITGDGKYKTAFETGSGADFLDIKESSIGKRNRILMEQRNFGIPANENSESRPTYGALVTDSKIGQFFNRMIGGKAGERFNEVTDPNSTQLQRYGDVSLIAKSRVRNRSSFFTGDTLEAYAQNSNNFGPSGSRSVPISGKPTDILNAARLGNLANPFGQRRVGNSFFVNSKPRYLETQTLGGFGLDDVAKIRVHSTDEAAKEIYNALRASGRNIKVYGPTGKLVNPFLPRFMGRLGAFGSLLDLHQGAKMIGSGQRFQTSNSLPTTPSGAFANGGIVNKYATGGSAIWNQAANDSFKKKQEAQNKKNGIQVWHQAANNSFKKKERALEKRSWEENTLDWFGGVGQWMGTLPGMKEFGEFYMSKDNFWSGATRALFGTLQLPLNLIGGVVNSAMMGVAAAQKGDLAGALYNFSGIPAITGALQSSYSGVLDPEKTIGTQFDAATETVIANEWFGTDTEAGKARARLVGGALNFVADPTMYVGVGALAKGATLAVTGAKSAAAASVVPGKSFFLNSIKPVSGTASAGSKFASDIANFKNKNSLESFEDAFGPNSRDLLRTFIKPNQRSTRTSIAELIIKNTDESVLPSSSIFTNHERLKGIALDARDEISKGLDEIGTGPDAFIRYEDWVSRKGYLESKAIDDAMALSPGMKSYVLNGRINNFNDLVHHLTEYTPTPPRVDPRDAIRAKNAALAYINAKDPLNLFRKASDSILSKIPKKDKDAIDKTRMGSLPVGSIASLILKDPKKVEAIDYLFNARHRSGTKIGEMLHPTDTPMATGRVYGPGTYLSQTVEGAEKFPFGPKYHRQAVTLQSILATARSKGYIDPEQMTEEMGKFFSDVPNLLGHAKSNNWRAHKETPLNEMAWDHPFIQNLIGQGYLGYKHGDAITNWVLGTSPEFRFAGAKPSKPKKVNLPNTPDMFASGGLVNKMMPSYFANGGMVSKIKPSYFNDGGLARGTDTIPAMLTPGEFVMSRSAVDNFGVDNLKAINSGQALQGAASNSQTSIGDSVYNSNSYSISVNVSSASDPDDIARTVMAQIQRIDAQTTRSNRY
jgi:TP901 family phage tail tape measure protein